MTTKPKTKHTRRNLLFGLLKSPPAAAPSAAVRMVAAVQPFDCLARRGQVCTVCAERCPVPGAVCIEGRKVSIVSELCTGCGTCQQVCPAPQNAIVLWPAQTRG